MTSLVPTQEKDYLDVDQPIRGQNYVCVSFLSPEDVLANKEVFTFSRYIEAFGQEIKHLQDNLRAKYPEDQGLFDTLAENYAHVSSADALQQHYRSFKALHGAKIEDDFLAAHEFRTCVRGIKVRGVFDTLEEARRRAQFLKNMGDKFDIFVAEVGAWCPWSPNPEDMKDVTYGETQLNTLMKKYDENMDLRDQHYEERKRDKLEKAARENEERRQAYHSQIEEDLAGPSDPWLTRKGDDKEQGSE